MSNENQGIILPNRTVDMSVKVSAEMRMQIAKEIMIARMEDYDTMSEKDFVQGCVSLADEFISRFQSKK